MRTDYLVMILLSICVLEWVGIGVLAQKWKGWVGVFWSAVSAIAGVSLIYFFYNYFSTSPQYILRNIADPNHAMGSALFGCAVIIGPLFVIAVATLPNKKKKR